MGTSDSCMFKGKVGRLCMRACSAHLAPFAGTRDKFNGVTVSAAELRSVPTVEDFRRRLEESLVSWKADGMTRGVWVKVPALKGEFVTELAKQGFTLHHADEGGIMLNKWISSSEANKMPGYASSFV